MSSRTRRRRYNGEMNEEAGMDAVQKPKVKFAEEVDYKM